TLKVLPNADIPPPLADPRGGDWREQARHAVRDLAGLERAIRLTESERAGVARALAGGFPLSITPYFLSLVDPDDPACPIRRQVVPTASEGVEVPGDLVDPLGEVE